MGNRDNTVRIMMQVKPESLKINTGSVPAFFGSLSYGYDANGSIQSIQGKGKSRGLCKGLITTINLGYRF